MVKVCGDKLRVSKRAGGREDRAGRGGAEINNQKQEPRTKMWGKTSVGFPANSGTDRIFWCCRKQTWQID